MLVDYEQVKEDLARKDEEIAKLKEAIGRLTKGIFFSTEEFMTLATFCMVNDTPEQNEDIDPSVLHSILDQIAIQQFDFSDWIAAFHGLD